MRNTWLIIKREYLERVRTRSFLVLTVLVPVIMTVFMGLPAALVRIGEKAQHLVIVTTTPQLGEMVRRELMSTLASLPEDVEAAAGEAPKKKPEDQYVLDVDANPSEAERAALRDKISTRAIDGYIWLTDEAIAAREVTWYSREMASPRERSWLREALSRIAVQQQLIGKGFTTDQADQLLKPVTVQRIRIENGRETKGTGMGRFFEIAVMITLLLMAVLLYGVSVMRSVLEEKNSRVMEVLLSSATSTQLMAGKLLGVGAVGLTQILVWIVMAGVLALPSLAAQPNLGELQVSPFALASFAVFFFLGYLLYSTMYAAIGAITTTEQEGQQIQFLVVIPLVLPLMMLVPVLRTPDSPAIVWLSMVPFFAPILMYARIVVHTPPLWQILLSLVLLTGTVGGLVVLCARIYRIGVLIYGKRATLPEILKWFKYANA